VKHIYKVYPGKEKKQKKNKGDASVRRSGDFVAVKDFNMEIEDGEFIVFVGPSGCGKSTTLRMIAGLEEISSGELYIGDRLINDVEPKDRDIAMVFQNYALYPHMTARNNIAFGLTMRLVPVEKKDKNGNTVLAIDKNKIKETQAKLKAIESDLQSSEMEETLRDGLLMKKSKLEAELKYYKETPLPVYTYKHVPKAEIAEKVDWAAKVLGVEELLDSKPKAMSGGQRQRIALGRAIVREPKVMLLDEPLSNLDAKLRTTMRAEIVKLHEQLKTTFIYVTHDQVEAMTMGTRIVVMKLGVVQQIDTPTNLFDYPDNKFVAGFIGTPQMNFFDVSIKKEGGELKVTFASGESQKYNLKAMRSIDEHYLDGEEHKVTLGIRGENISIDASGLSTKLTLKEILGNTTQLLVKMPNAASDYIVCLSERNNYKTGDEIKIKFDERRIHLVDNETERSIMSRDCIGE
ncbi:MAG: ABC transporter ATP-binding protein, partial [Clostridia bacterium]|nr:ABC transporter ATP-binding protein [Clostridia bacterium]